MVTGAQQQRDSSLAADLTKALRAEALEGVVSAYLFGSFARGRAHRESDVDVGVLVDRDRHPVKSDRFDAGLVLAGRLESVLGRRVDLVVLNDAPPLLARDVVTRGQRVLCLDPETDHAFVRDVQLRAADLAPFLARARRVKLSVLVG